jgi:hypothetical protein
MATIGEHKHTICDLTLFKHIYKARNIWGCYVDTLLELSLKLDT